MASKAWKARTSRKPYLAFALVLVAATSFLLAMAHRPPAQPPKAVGPSSEQETPPTTGQQETSRVEDQSFRARLLSIELTLLGGKRISVKDLLSEGKPVLFYFFATWCPACARDLASLSTAYELYRDKVKVVLVAFDPTESLEELHSYAEMLCVNRTFKECFTPSELANPPDYSNFIIVRHSPELIRTLGVFAQASKVGISPWGDVVFSQGYGVMGPASWRKALEQMVKSSGG